MGTERGERWVPSAGHSLFVSTLASQISAGSKLLHQGFVVQLLNDLFGVQARGGCLCAGPYAQQLLGMSEGQSQLLQQQLLVELEELVSRCFFPSQSASPQSPGTLLLS
jgi:hypothetical protein